MLGVSFYCLSQSLSQSLVVQLSETVHFVYSTDAPSAAEKHALCQAIIDAFPVLKDSTTPRGYVSNFNLTKLKTRNPAVADINDTCLSACEQISQYASVQETKEVNK